MTEYSSKYYVESLTNEQFKKQHVDIIKIENEDGIKYFSEVKGLGKIEVEPTSPCQFTYNEPENGISLLFTSEE